MAEARYFSLPDVIALAENYRPLVVRLSPDSLTLLLCTEPFTAALFHWSGESGEPTPTEADIIDALIGQTYGELMVTPMLATIFPFASTAPPEGSLLCDGAIYLRTDYPNLYARLDAAYIVDADTFAVPDLTASPSIGIGWAIWSI